MRVVLKVPPAAMWSVFFVFLSYLDKNFVKGEFPNYSLDAEKESKDVLFMLNSTFCAKVSGMGGNVLHQVSNGAEEVRSVYNQAHKLVDCSVTTNQMQVKAFMHVCRLGLKDQRTNPEYRELSFVDMTEAKVKCQSFQKTSMRSAVESVVAPTAQTRKGTENPVHKKDKPVLRRSKRGFTYPGTLWCGAGNMADNYDDLGEFAATDSCCRVHDHCPYVIHAFSSNYGYTNFKWHPLSHCDCDNALKVCLRKVNDTSSRVVGQAFFNVLEVPCFEFKYEEQCVERHWYGACKRYGMLPVAVPTESIPYDFGGIDVIDVLTLAPLVRKEKKTGIEQDQTEGTTQSTVSGSPTSGPEEPSLRNVFTAAEDFIKVLATVSTSQGTATDTTKGETQTSEKKKRKNPAGTKKKNKKRKGKGKGRKKKQKIFSKGAEEGITVTPTQAEEAVNKGNFVNEPEKVAQLNRNVKSFTDGEKDLGGKDKFNNDVMRDDPRVDDQSATDASVNSVAIVKKEQIILETLAMTGHTEAASPFTATAPPIVTTTKTKRKRSRKGEGRKTQSNITLTAPTNRVKLHDAIKGDLPAMTTEDSGIRTMPASAAVISAEQPEQQRLERQSEKGPVTAMASPISHIVTAIKSQRSKKSEDRNKTRKITSFLPMMGVIFPNITEVSISVIPTERTGSPAINSNSAVANITVTGGRSVSHRPESYIDRGSTVNLTQSAVKTKRHRPNDREGRKIRRKKVRPTLSFEGPSLQNTMQKALETHNTDNTAVQSTSSAVSTRVVTAELSESLAPQSTEGQCGKGHLTFTASHCDPIEAGRRLAYKEREGRKTRKKVSMTTDVTEKVPVHNDTATKLEEMTTTYPTPSASTVLSAVDQVREFSPQSSEDHREQAFFHVQASTPTMGPTLVTIQKTKRLGRKKRRKAPHTDSY